MSPMEANKNSSPYLQTSGEKANLESSFIILSVCNVGRDVRRPECTEGTAVSESWGLNYTYPKCNLIRDFPLEDIGQE